MTVVVEEEEETAGQPGNSIEGIIILKPAFGDSEDKGNILNNWTKDLQHLDTRKICDRTGKKTEFIYIQLQSFLVYVESHIIEIELRRSPYIIFVYATSNLDYSSQ